MERDPHSQRDAGAVGLAPLISTPAHAGLALRAGCERLRGRDPGARLLAEAELSAGEGQETVLEKVGFRVAANESAPSAQALSPGKRISR